MKTTQKSWGQTLINWFEKEQRDLPWRQNYALYEVWLSEIMLQQTKMETALPYFRRFLQRFPTVHHLAEAPLEEVLQYWEGLGYYRRARQLHASAKIIAEKGFPQTKEGWLALPGIGDYTASAICAIALEQDEIALDGNLERVGTRIWDMEGIPSKKILKEKFHKDLPKGQARAFNQALMELGSLVCNKMKPKCMDCPIQKTCLAFKNKTVAQRPLPKVRPKTIHQEVCLAIFLREDHTCFIQKRAPNQALAGLWEFPDGKVEPGESLEEALRRELQEEVSFSSGKAVQLCTVNQFFTHHKIKVHAFVIELEQDFKTSLLQSPLDHQWVAVKQLDAYPMPQANRSIVNLLKKCYNI